MIQDQPWLLSLLKENKVAEVAIRSNQIQGKLKEPGSLKGNKIYFRTVRVDSDTSRLLDQYGVTFKGEIESTFLRDLLSWIFPIFLFVGVWYFFMKRMSGQRAKVPL